MAGTAGFFHGTSVSAWNSARHRTYLQCSAAQSTATKPQKVSVQEVTDFRKVRNSLASVWLEWLSLQAAAVPPALLVPAAVLGLELSSDCVHFILQTWLPRLLQSQDSTRKWLQLATERRQVIAYCSTTYTAAMQHGTSSISFKWFAVVCCRCLVNKSRICTTNSLQSPLSLPTPLVCSCFRYAATTSIPCSLDTSCKHTYITKRIVFLWRQLEPCGPSQCM